MSDHLEPYEIKSPWFSGILEWIALIFFGIAPFCYGILYWNKVDYEAPKLAVIMGLLMIYASLYSFFKYGNAKFIIRIDKQGIHHRVIDHIEWNDITEVYLDSIRTKYGTMFYIVVNVKNSQKYKDGDNSFLKHRSRSGNYILPIGVNNEKAKIAEITIKSYLTQLARRLG